MVVGGFLVAPVLILIVLPVMIELFSNRQPRVIEGDADWLDEGLMPEPKP